MKVKGVGLTPKEILYKVQEASVNKGKMSTGPMLVSAILAGMFIACGALFFTMVMADATLGFAIQRLLGGLVFCLGLVLVLCCGAELFTGNTLMICGKLNSSITWKQLFRNWGIVILGNLIGALLIVLIVYGAQVFLLNGGLMGETLVSLAIGKINQDWFVLFLKGIMCNFFVALAAWIGFASSSITDKVIGTLLPVSAFVAVGFEHCIANMFFLPFGLLLSNEITIAGILYNLSAVIPGNIVGGVVLVGLAYWYIYHDRKKKSLTSEKEIEYNNKSSIREYPL